MSNISQFDVATAALEHLELLNHSNQNPLEIAAQFRTLLRSKKNNKNVHSSNIDYTYMDYITMDATIRKRRYSQNLADRQSNKSFGKIQYDLDENRDAVVRSDQRISNQFRYPTINWKQLRKKQYEHKLEQFISTKFKIKNSNISKIRKTSEEIISISSSSRSRSSSASIRTPSISPINCLPPTYTISRLNSTLLNHNNEDIFFPIADCNLVIKHKPIERISHLEDFL